MTSATTNAELCLHRSLSLPHTLLYCFTLASFFVISLYIFVPCNVRKLPRNHATHIKWRAGIVMAVAAVGIAVYPWLFCEKKNRRTVLEGQTRTSYFHYIPYIGISTSSKIQATKVVCHAAILYLGSFAFCWLRFYHYARFLQSGQYSTSERLLMTTSPSKKQLLPLLPKPHYMIASINSLWITPTKHSLHLFLKDETYRWTILRNLIIAPISEEVIFRACIIAPLLSSSSHRITGTTTTTTKKVLRPTQVCWISPLFFGLAHLHHFYEQYRKLPIMERTKDAILKLTIGVLFQFLYTTLFGAYASHVFIRTGSLFSVILVHIFCNYMGLPEVGFVSPASGLYCYRWLLICMYSIGIVLFFTKGFDSSWGVFPAKSVLPSLLLRIEKQKMS